jgi:Ca2+-binding EF-hand superfamily protein
MSAEKVQEHFLSMIVVNDNEVTKEEFVAFYNDVNVNFAHNDIFFRYVSSQWHFTPERLKGVSEEAIKNAIKTLRFKLIEKTQGSKDELIVRKVFDEYDANKNFYLSPYDLSQMLLKLEVSLEPVLIEKVHERLDKNGSGYIEF